MPRKRRQHADEFKAKVAVEALKGVHTLAELSATYQVHPTVIAQWKRQLLDGAPTLFRRGAAGAGRDQREPTAPLFEEIGRLKVEVDFLKKKLYASP